MLTVVIAEKQFIDLYERLHVFVKPLMREEIVFCEWNREGSNLMDMLPDIYDIVKHQTQWRAVIVDEDRLSQVNPFDKTQYVDQVKLPRRKAPWEQLRQRQEQRLAAYDAAAKEPLTRLTTGLCGIPAFQYVIEDADVYQALLSGEKPLYAYMLERQLQELNCKETVQRLRQYQYEELGRLIGPESVDALIDAVGRSDAGAILEIVSAEDITSVQRLLGMGDPTYTDPEYNESLVESTYRRDLLKQIWTDFEFKDTLPTDVVCVAPRCFDYDRYIQGVNWTDPDELNYSHFSEFNLFHDKLKYFVFDMVPQDNKKYQTDQLRMVSFLLILAANPVPDGCCAPHRVYRADIAIDSQSVKHVFSEYVSRLNATSLMIREISRSLDQERDIRLDNKTARELFESDINVPVEITEFSHADLMADGSKSGLTRTCPKEETSVWADQFKGIKKQFIRYMREPQRALKAAIANEFRPQNRIDDERVHQISENQREDVQYKLLEEEQKMVSIQTPALFDVDGYSEAMNSSATDLGETIRRRLSKSAALLAGGLAIAGYFLGFLPLLLSNLKTAKSLTASIVTIVIGLSVLIAISLGVLFWYRHTTKQKYRQFNRTMDGICYDVEAGLSVFANYLSHACNMMREASVLRTFDSIIDRKQRILAFHGARVEATIQEAAQFFTHFIDSENVEITEADPYDYDFTVLKEYDYPIPYSDISHAIEYMQEGQTAEIGADYIVAIEVDRVEIYD